MKKIAIIALAVLASASFTTADAAKKKDKKQQQAPVVLPVQLNNGCDSLSYVAGMYMTEGLYPYIKQQGVDSAYIEDFKAGFKEAAFNMDPHQKARIIGTQIANQVLTGMVPRMQKEFTDTRDTLIVDVLLRGFCASLDNDSSIFSQTKAVAAYQEKKAWNQQEKEERLYGPNRDAGIRFLDSLKADTSVIRTESGLMYKVLVKGEGDVPQKTDKVLVNYEGRLVDGTVFDASAKHGDKPASFKANQVIKGWTEALTMMPVGSKWQLYIPYDLAYGTRGTGNIKPYSTLIFDVELVGIDNTPAVQHITKEFPINQSTKKSTTK